MASPPDTIRAVIDALDEPALIVANARSSPMARRANYWGI
jgi:hypothetical protein